MKVGDEVIVVNEEREYRVGQTSKIHEIQAFGKNQSLNYKLKLKDRQGNWMFLWFQAEAIRLLTPLDKVL